MDRVAIVSAVRTPLGKLGGSLKKIQAEELTRVVLEGAIKKVNLDPSQIDEVIIGQAKQSTEAPNIARVASLKAGWDESIPSYSVHRQCASGMQSILNGVQQIQTGYSDIVVAGGVESMSTAPFYVRGARFGVGSGNTEFVDPNTESQPKSQPQEIYGEFNMIDTAENVAKKYNISREDQDEFALSSQVKAIDAQDAGRFADEIVPVYVPQRKKEDLVFDEDEYPRRDTSIEKLAKLRTIREGGTVTAGNASGRNDGAAAVVLVRESIAKDLKMPILGYVIGASAVGVDPRYMGMGPWPATEKLLNQLNAKIEDFGLYEINEAFASQSVACARKLNLDIEKLNVNGGAIALGHPLGCSGTRISVTLLHEMRRRGVQRGFASICVAGGLGMAMAFENPEA